MCSKGRGCQISSVTTATRQPACLAKQKTKKKQMCIHPICTLTLLQHEAVYLWVLQNVQTPRIYINVKKQVVMGNLQSP